MKNDVSETVPSVAVTVPVLVYFTYNVIGSSEVN
jgi:hypothetical protein